MVDPAPGVRAVVGEQERRSMPWIGLLAVSQLDIFTNGNSSSFHIAMNKKILCACANGNYMIFDAEQGRMGKCFISRFQLRD
jgi:hypothetical protein